jgi:hypothetical protein
VVGLVNELDQEKAAGKAGQLAIRLVNIDAVILDRITHHCRSSRQETTPTASNRG